MDKTFIYIAELLTAIVERKISICLPITLANFTGTELPICKAILLFDP